MGMSLRFLWVLTFLLLTLNLTHAQEVIVHGRFQKDSVAIGEWVPFSLTARYPSAQQVVFPDSTFSFQPFELRKKQFYPTRTSSGTSYDSAVYYLTTFEIDRVQRMRLPVFVLQAQDCVTVQSEQDSILLSYRVSKVPDSVSVEQLPLKTNTAYQKVSWLFNYPVYSIVAVVLIILLVASWLIFGKSVRRYFTLKRLTKDYQRFLAEFSKSMERLSAEFTARKAEETLLLWKQYMENLDRQPFTKFTSREIYTVAGDKPLAQALQEIDRGIYGGRYAGVDPFKVLESYTQKQFHKRQTEVKHG